MVSALSKDKDQIIDSGLKCSELKLTKQWGESQLSVRPINKHTLWVLVGRKEELSLREYPGELKELRLDEKWNKMNR